MQSFTIKTHDPRTDDPIVAEINYEMQDIGVMMEHNENVQPIILSVINVESGDDIQEFLNEDELAHLKEVARDHNGDLGAASKWGEWL